MLGSEVQSTNSIRRWTHGGWFVGTRLIIPRTAKYLREGSYGQLS